MLIKELITQIRGVSYKPSDVLDKTTGVPILRANNIDNDEVNYDELIYISKDKINDKQYLKIGDVFICASSGSKNLVGKAAVLNSFESPISFGAFCKVIRVNDSENINKDYIRYFFRSKLYRQQMSNFSIGANINNIKAENIDDLIINVPKLDAQNKAVESFESLISALNIKKKELLSLDELIKSRFIEMFGDPMFNNKGYSIKTYGELFELNAGGTPSKTKKEYWQNGSISWIGSNLCQNVILYKNDGKYITQEGYNHSSARMFAIDTVLVALVGATIGKTALLKFETTTNQNVLGIRNIKEAGYNPMFVFYYTQFLNNKFQNIGDGGFNMASKGFVGKLPMYDVSLDEQNMFALFAEQIDKSKFIVQQQIKDLQELLDKKMDEYFSE